MKSSCPFGAHDSVHLATGMVVVDGVIREGAILTNCFTNGWSVVAHGKAFSEWTIGIVVPSKYSWLFLGLRYSLKLKCFLSELNQMVILTRTLLYCGGSHFAIKYSTVATLTDPCTAFYLDIAIWFNWLPAMNRSNGPLLRLNVQICFVCTWL